MKPETKAKIKKAITIAPRQPTFKTILGGYISSISVMFAFFSSGIIPLPVLVTVASVMLIPIIMSYLGLPTNIDSGKRVAQLAATVIETIRGSSMDDRERQKLEMIIMLSVGEWDQINTMLERFEENSTPIQPDRIKNKLKEVEDDEEEEEIT